MNGNGKRSCGLALLLGLALAARAELVSLGEWPLDETRCALQVDRQLYRNCGRVLERWDLASEPPTLLDSLVLESPPVDLLDWDGLLLVQRDDGVLEARDPAADWSAPVWSIELPECVEELLRVGDWLLPISPYFHGVDLADPRQPVLSNWVLDGNDQACWVDGRLVGDAEDCCGTCWDIVTWNTWMEFDASGPGLAQGSVGAAIPSWGPFDLAACDTLLAVAQGSQLALYDSPSWNLIASHSLSGGLEDEIRMASRDLELAISLPGQLLMFRFMPGTAQLVLEDELAVPGGRDIQWTEAGLLVTSPGGTSLVHVGDGGELDAAWELDAPGPLHAVGRLGDRLLVRHDELLMLEDGPTGWQPVARLPLGIGECLAVDGMRVLVDSDSVLLMLDVADPLHPAIAATLPHATTRFALDGSRAAVLDAQGLHVYDVEEPASPRLMGTMTIDQPSGLSVAAGVVAVVSGAETVLLIDARDVDSLLMAGEIPFPVAPGGDTPARHAGFCGYRLMLGCDHQGDVSRRSLVQSWNVEDPATPRLEGEWARDYDGLWSFQASRDRLLVSTGARYWGSVPDYTLLDVMEGSSPQATASWSGESDVWRELSHTPLPGGWLATCWSPGGLELLLDDSILPVEPAAPRPASLLIGAAPNPFNPLTRLSFTLDRPGHARLAVFDLLGREVALPLDGELAAGVHDIAFDASALASGVYIARLETTTGAAVVKLALVR